MQLFFSFPSWNEAWLYTVLGFLSHCGYVAEGKVIDFLVMERWVVNAIVWSIPHDYLTFFPSHFFLESWKAHGLMLPPHLFCGVERRVSLFFPRQLIRPHILMSRMMGTAALPTTAMSPKVPTFTGMSFAYCHFVKPHSFSRKTFTFWSNLIQSQFLNEAWFIYKQCSTAEGFFS